MFWEEDILIKKKILILTYRSIADLEIVICFDTIVYEKNLKSAGSYDLTSNGRLSPSYTNEILFIFSENEAYEFLSCIFIRISDRGSQSVPYAHHTGSVVNKRRLYLP